MRRNVVLDVLFCTEFVFYTDIGGFNDSPVHRSRSEVSWSSSARSWPRPSHSPCPPRPRAWQTAGRTDGHNLVRNVELLYCTEQRATAWRFTLLQDILNRAMSLNKIFVYFFISSRGIWQEFNKASIEYHWDSPIYWNDWKNCYRNNLCSNIIP
jgi:hypothetical protein